MHHLKGEGGGDAITRKGGSRGKKRMIGGWEEGVNHGGWKGLQKGKNSEGGFRKRGGDLGRQNTGGEGERKRVFAASGAGDENQKNKVLGEWKESSLRRFESVCRRKGIQGGGKKR